MSDHLRFGHYKVRKDRIIMSSAAWEAVTIFVEGEDGPLCFKSGKLGYEAALAYHESIEAEDPADRKAEHERRNEANRAALEEQLARFERQRGLGLTVEAAEHPELAEAFAEATAVLAAGPELPPEARDPNLDRWRNGEDVPFGGVPKPCGHGEGEPCRCPEEGGRP